MKYLAIINFVLTVDKCYCHPCETIQDDFIIIYYIDNQLFNFKIQECKYNDED